MCVCVSPYVCMQHRGLERELSTDFLLTVLGWNLQAGTKKSRFEKTQYRGASRVKQRKSAMSKGNKT